MCVCVCVRSRYGYDHHNIGDEGANQECKKREHCENDSHHSPLHALLVANGVNYAANKVHQAETDGCDGPNEARVADQEHNDGHLFEEVLVGTLVQLELNPLLVRK